MSDLFTDWEPTTLTCEGEFLRKGIHGPATHIIAIGHGQEAKRELLVCIDCAVAVRQSSNETVRCPFCKTTLPSDQLARVVGPIRQAPRG